MTKRTVKKSAEESKARDFSFAELKQENISNNIDDNLDKGRNIEEQMTQKLKPDVKVDVVDSNIQKFGIFDFFKNLNQHEKYDCLNCQITRDLEKKSVLASFGKEVDNNKYSVTCDFENYKAKKNQEITADNLLKQGAVKNAKIYGYTSDGKRVEIGTIKKGKISFDQTNMHACGITYKDLNNVLGGLVTNKVKKALAKAAQVDTVQEKVSECSIRKEESMVEDVKTETPDKEQKVEPKTMFEELKDTIDENVIRATKLIEETVKDLRELRESMSNPNFDLQTVGGFQELESSILASKNEGEKIIKESNNLKKPSKVDKVNLTGRVSASNVNEDAKKQEVLKAQETADKLKPQDVREGKKRRSARR